MLVIPSNFPKIFYIAFGLVWYGFDKKVIFAFELFPPKTPTYPLIYFLPMLCFWDLFFVWSPRTEAVVGVFLSPRDIFDHITWLKSGNSPPNKRVPFFMLVYFPFLFMFHHLL